MDKLFVNLNNINKQKRERENRRTVRMRMFCRKMVEIVKMQDFVIRLAVRDTSSLEWECEWKQKGKGQHDDGSEQWQRSRPDKRGSVQGRVKERKEKHKQRKLNKLL